MEEKLNNLITNGFFRNVEVDEKGYGTFMKDPEHKKPTNPFLEQARSLKREADLLNKKNRNEGKVGECRSVSTLYIKSIFCYIKGYKLDESKIHRNNSIIHWKGLYKYIKELEAMTEDRKTKDFLNTCSFAVKFHYLNLEAKGLETKEQILAFSKEFHSLYQKFNSLQNKIKLDDLEYFFNKQ